MEYRTTWLTGLSDSELIGLDPWTILTADTARGFFVMAARDALRSYKRFGLSHMSNEELLQEVYTMLHSAVPGILKNCLAEAAPENRDKYVYGSLRTLIRKKLPHQVFGAISPNDIFYIEEMPMLPDEADDSYMVSSHSLMHPALNAMNSYLESQPNYQPQFLSESQFVPEEQVQLVHRLIEKFRPYLTSREVVVLRNLLMNYSDRSMVALEVGTTPKMVSRYRHSIQRKMKSVLVDLGWSAAELTALLGKPSPSVEGLLRGAND